MTRTPRPPKQRRLIRRLIGLFIAHSVVTILVALAALLYGWTSQARSLPELSGWHLEVPADEFTAGDARAAYTLDDYLVQEALVFDQLDAFIRGPWATEDAGHYCRYRADSPSSPTAVSERDWNRTFVFEQEHPVAGALLLHGLSDAPYSLRAAGLRLHEEGYHVVGLRLPGHGTSPSALAKVSYKDWRAAVRVAVASLRAQLPADAPLMIMGYSNGGALALDYALATIEDDTLVRADALVLVSPMIAISPLAELTRFYHVITTLSGEKKAAWQNISAEIDPYKYGSWPMNASVQAWRMTRRIGRRLEALADAGRLDQLPPILTFQSAVDSTVNVPAIINRLFNRLSPGGHELVLFDVNRAGWLDSLINLSFENTMRPALTHTTLPYTLTVVTNADENQLNVVASTYRKGTPVDRPLGLAWPPKVFSLSHIALPIPPDDPLYGRNAATSPNGLSLDFVGVQGERGVLTVGDTLGIRIRYNPFYSFSSDHTQDWLRATLPKTARPVEG